jgi:hypothetical protein
MKKHPNTSKRGKQLLNKLAKIGPFLPASVSVTKKRCGRASCRCEQEGPIHPTAHVTWKEQGITRTLHVPQDAIGEVVQWVKAWKELRRLIAEMGKEQRKHLQQIKKQLKD